LPQAVRLFASVVVAVMMAVVLAHMVVLMS
jgi:hypothetical protein